MKITNIIWIEDDDGVTDLHSILSTKEVFQAGLIITDKGRVLKNRFGPISDISSFDLVKGAEPNPSKTRLKYRSIYDPSDIQDEL